MVEKEVSSLIQKLGKTDVHKQNSILELQPRFNFCAKNRSRLTDSKEGTGRKKLLPLLCLVHRLSGNQRRQHLGSEERRGPHSRPATARQATEPVTRAASRSGALPNTRSSVKWKPAGSNHPETKVQRTDSIIKQK